MTLIAIGEIVGGVITLYLLYMIARELYKIATQRDQYNDKIDLP